MSQTLPDEIRRQDEALFGEHDAFIDLWQTIAELTYPARADFTGDNPWGMENFTRDIYDSTPIRYRRDLGNSISATLRPEDQPWFRAQWIDQELRENTTATAVMDYITAQMRTLIYAHGTQFIIRTKEVDHDFVTFGQGVLRPEERDESYAERGICFHCDHVRDCAWAEDQKGEIDTMHRRMELTVRQAVKTFDQPGDDLDKAIAEAVTREPQRKFDFRHVMMRREDYLRWSDDERMRAFPYVSIYYDQAHNKVVRKKGSFEFRYVVPRWQRLSGSVYAQSPATADALPDARGLQTVAATVREAVQKSVDPPGMAREEAVRGDIEFGPAGITWVDREYDSKLGAPLELFTDIGKNAPVGLQLWQMERANLADTMLVSKLRPPLVQNREVTAYQVQQMLETYAVEAEPIYGPIGAVYNGPMLNEVFRLGWRMGAFDRVKPWLRQFAPGRMFGWMFINPLKQNLERVKVQLFQTNMGMLQLAATFDPEAMADADVRQMFRDAAAGSGAPAKWLRPREAADAINAAKAEAAAQQAQAQQAQQAIQGIEGAGKALGATASGLSQLGALNYGPLAA